MSTSLPSSNPVLFERVNGKHAQIGLITLNRPNQYNAINTRMYRALYQQLHIWETDPCIQAVVITAAGQCSFCAGGDLKAIYHAYKHHTLPESNLFYHGYRTNHRLFHYKKPVISWVFGHTLGGGVGLSLYAQYRIGSPSLKWGMPETRIGFYPDVGTLSVLCHYPDNLGVWLALSGDTVSAQYAHTLGIIHAVLPQHRFSDWLQALSQTDLAHHAFEKIQACSLPFSLPQDKPTPDPHWDTIRTFSSRYLNAMHAPFSAHQCLEKLRTQAKVSPHAGRLYAHFQQHAPTSMGVTLQGLYDAYQHDFDFCIQQNYDVTQTFLTENNFFDGIHAAIIDKQYVPTWCPGWEDTQRYTHSLIRCFSKKGKYALFTGIVHGE